MLNFLKIHSLSHTNKDQEINLENLYQYNFSLEFEDLSYLRDPKDPKFRQPSFNVVKQNIQKGYKNII